VRGSRRPARTLPRHRRCVRPQIPGLSPGWSGASPYVLRAPGRAFLRFPVCPPRFVPVVRLRMVSLRPAFSGCSLRPLPGSGSLRFPSGFPFPWAIFTLALPRGGPAGVGPGRQGPRSAVLPRHPRLGRPRSPRAAGGQRPGTRDAAAGSPITSGRERTTSSRPAAIAENIWTLACRVRYRRLGADGFGTPSMAGHMQICQFCAATRHGRRSSSRQRRTVTPSVALHKPGCRANGDDQLDPSVEPLLSNSPASSGAGALAGIVRRAETSSPGGSLMPPGMSSWRGAELTQHPEPIGCR
jgi:hypothetical protein